MRWVRLQDWPFGQSKLTGNQPYWRPDPGGLWVTVLAEGTLSKHNCLLPCLSFLTQELEVTTQPPQVAPPAAPWSKGM